MRRVPMPALPHPDHGAHVVEEVHRVHHPAALPVQVHQIIEDVGRGHRLHHIGRHVLAQQLQVLLGPLHHLLRNREHDRVLHRQDRVAVPLHQQLQVVRLQAQEQRLQLALLVRVEVELLGAAHDDVQTHAHVEPPEAPDVHQQHDGEHEAEVLQVEQAVQRAGEAFLAQFDLVLDLLDLFLQQIVHVDEVAAVAGQFAVVSQLEAVLQRTHVLEQVRKVLVGGTVNIK